MATKVELPSANVKDALEMKLTSLRRAQKTSSNPKLVAVYEEEIKIYQTAIGTLTETR